MLRSAQSLNVRISAQWQQIYLKEITKSSNMETFQIIGTTIVFDDAYTGAEKFGRILSVYGDNATVRLISKDAAGPDPRRVIMKPDAHTAEITRGTGVVN